MFEFLARMFRRTQPADQSSGGYYYGRGEAGVHVDQYSAMSLPAYVACVRVLSGTFAQMPWRVRENTARGTRVADAHLAHQRLYAEPNRDTEAAAWKRDQMRDFVIWGNAYSEIERDRSNRPINLWPIEPHRVRPFRDADNSVWYEVQNTGSPSYIPAADMLHFRGPGDTDLCGQPLLQYGANAIGLGLAETSSASAMMRNGTRVSGVMSPAGNATIKDNTLKALQEKFDERYSGPRNHGGVIWANNGMRYDELRGWNAAEMELIDSRKFSVLDICRLMGVPPHLAYDMDRATFSNIEHQNLSYLMYSMNPILVVFQQQADRKLISRANRSRYHSHIYTQALLRSDMAARGAFYNQLFNLAAISPNEIRELEDMNPIPGGNQHFRPLNMESLTAPAQPAETNANGNTRGRTAAGRILREDFERSAAGGTNGNGRQSGGAVRQ